MADEGVFEILLSSGVKYYLVSFSIQDQRQAPSLMRQIHTGQLSGWVSEAVGGEHFLKYVR
jgi:hypothetical protein